LLPSHFVSAEEVHYETLKNGLRVVIVKNDLASVVTTEVNYLVGSNECPDAFPGMAHAQEHMMFRGSPGLSSQQLASLVSAQDHGIHIPDPFRHKHPPIQDTNKLFFGQLTSGQQTADRFAKMMGSWTFIITQSIFLGIWAILNTITVVT